MSKKILTPIEVVSQAMDNPFVKNIEKISAIATREKVDVGVALSMYINDTYGNKKGDNSFSPADVREYKYLVSKYRFDKLVKLVEEVKKGANK